MPIILTSLLIGAVGGVVAALCGVGGGVLMVPAFVLLLKMEQKTAVATSLAAIILMALAASLKNSKNLFVQWNVAIPAGIAGAVVAWFVADALKKFQNETLTRIFAVLMVCLGVIMWLQAGAKKVGGAKSVEEAGRKE